MMLVASCPAGNISNFLVHLARGNTALSVSISSASTVLSVVMTPLVLRLLGFDVRAHARILLRTVAVDPVDMFVTIFVLLGLPLTVGMFVARRWPAFAERVRVPLKRLSIGIFALVPRVRARRATGSTSCATSAAWWAPCSCTTRWR